MKIKNFEFSASLAEHFRALAKAPHSFFLDSSNNKGFSFFGAWPYKVVGSLDALENEIKKCAKHLPSLPKHIKELPFCGGAVGFIAYDAVRGWEKHLSPHKKEPSYLKDWSFGFYDAFGVLNHKTRELSIISLGLTPQSETVFNRLIEAVERPPVPTLITSPKSEDAPEPQANMTYDEYSKRIAKAKRYIEEGEIYQVNLSQLFQVSLKNEPYSIYEKLRRLNPAPYSAYFNTPEGQILSSSPELFLWISENGLIRTQPIKGTIKRGDNEADDIAFKKELLASEKNRAELMMIVDLERNDLGKICHYGTVTVPTLMELKTFATVHHLVSTVEGKLRNRALKPIFQAMFPSGSITGAPKLRAMQIIDELEPHGRGIYTGSIGMIDYRRQVHMNVAIRTMMCREGTFTFPLGGGIVSGSVAREEYEETLHKGKALISAVYKP